MFLLNLLFLTFDEMLMEVITHVPHNGYLNGKVFYRLICLSIRTDNLHSILLIFLLECV